jgi:ATP-dependent DNA helicase DinG
VTPNNHLDIASALARVTDQIDAAEERPGQLAMAQEVQDAIAQGRPTIIEAGTGIGKSLAYLVPAVLSHQTTVVATATKALQDQLISKEIPSIKSAGIPAKAAVLKGRLNYLCQKKHADLKDRPPSLDMSGDDIQLRKISTWATTTVSGERDELDFEPSGSLWSQLSMSADECPGAERCPFGVTCFAERAKAEAARADLIIVNSALYGAHLSTGRTLLPPHATVIFDEAHELPDILSRALGVEVNAPRIHAAASLARHLPLAGLPKVLTDLHDAADSLGLALQERVESVGVDPATNLALVATTLVLDRLFTLLDDTSGATSTDELTRLSVRGVVVHLRAALTRFLSPDSGDLIFTEGVTRPTLVCAPVEVGHLLAPLWAEVTPVFTSATIPDGLDIRLGLTSPATFSHPSPYDYLHHALLYVPSHLSDRRAPESETEIADELTTLIRAAGGRTLALFTSRRALEEIGAVVRSRLDTPVLLQGESSRASLLGAFTDNEETSLFATMGFWQGVDIPGRTLSLLTIDRLPFGRPDDPMLEARRERAGSRAFYSVDLPRAAMLLAQGTGRLIRNATDRGVVCVFDTRLSSSSYKAALLSRLPPMRRTTSQKVALEFLAQMDH